MTFKEKFMQEHPGEDFETIVRKDCPYEYGYEAKEDYACHELKVISCAKCWDREFIGTEDDIVITHNTDHEVQVFLKKAVTYLLEAKRIFNQYGTTEQAQELEELCNIEINSYETKYNQALSEEV